MVGISECLICKKEFKWRRAKNSKPASYCSRKCMAKRATPWILENRFLWRNAKPEERFTRMKELFEKHVVRQEGCWDWNGSIHHSGYAPLKIDKIQIGAHKVSYLLYRGEISEDLNVLHHCDNRKCTNPDHLFLGTYRDNTLDMLKKKRGRHPHGENHVHAKLNPTKVIEIRKLLAMGVTMTRISKDYNISNGALCAIKYGTTWKHVK